ncbi:hypothetical protein GCM10010910_14260 [Microbacterium nanhaiense]|uniref:DUF559 domain-containing protein n=1 Tax=Microbacterium nanhaiense TaxID=1301026 RepID=A0ABQ2N1C8_9MICO|nr:DUF559 domain-containing protein [Microbacterium nanhaiense]GGO62933.1 hypothetical protein GCM10010910_14260 [Microbacterium nanhaiense]
MTARTPLPEQLGSAFHVSEAISMGVSRSRLNGSDLMAPFRGARTTLPPEPDDAPPEHRVLRLARAAAPLLGPNQFFSHETAAAAWGVPIHVREELHVTVFGNASFPRVAGLTGHRALPRMARRVLRDGLPVASPATTWAMLSHRSLDTLVVAGDYLCRVWRDGRPGAGTPPLATIGELRAAVFAGRRIGGAKLRAALELIAVDSWSPRESMTRIALLRAGLPMPELNRDIRDSRGTFLGCVDMCFPDFHVIVEYQGEQHARTYAADVERIARLRAAGWNVIEVTKELLADPYRLAARVRAALLAGGWDPSRTARVLAASFT